MANSSYLYNFDSPCFYNTMILDSSILIDDKDKDTSLFLQTEIVRRYSCMLHLERIAVKSINDYWLFIGISSFLADVFVMHNSADSFTLAI